MTTYFESDLASMERFYRANLLSALSGIKPAILVGTASSDGVNNLALFQNIVHLGANPALIGIINRPRAATPHTLSNIEQTGVFTLNSVHQPWVEKAHQTTARYDSVTDEFIEAGLTPMFAEDWKAPFVAESIIQVALELVEIKPVLQNDTYFIIGAVKFCRLPEAVIGNDGFVSVDQLRTVCTVGLDGYAPLASVQRFAHAKPGEPVMKL